VDVNTGKFVGSGGNLEETVTKNNLEAADEIVRQLRLRDIGGIIVVDFIDMESRGNRDKVLHELRTHLGRDRARTRAFEVSELGLIEMTRQRVRPSLFQSAVNLPGAWRGRASLASRNRGPPDRARHPPHLRQQQERQVTITSTPNSPSSWSRTRVHAPAGRNLKVELDLRDDPLP
jgi:hypothetical protein